MNSSEYHGIEKNDLESLNKSLSFFDDSPISLWEEDFSDIKKYFELLSNLGINDFRAYFKNHPDEFNICAKKIKIINVNKAALALYKAKNKNDLCANLNKIFTQESFEILGEGFIALGEGENKFEGEAIVQTLLGERKYLSFQWLVVPGYEKTLARILSSHVDITKRKKTEEELRASEARYRGIFNSATDGFIIFDYQGNIIEVNHQVCKMYGYEHDCFLTLCEKDIIHPDHHRYFEKIYTTKNKEFDEFPKEIIGVKKNNESINIEVKVTDIEFQGKLQLLAIVRDITDRIRADEEKRLLEAQLIHANKMEAIGTLAGGIAHDFNNLLMAIQGLTSLMFFETPQNHPCHPHLQRVEKVIKKGASLTKQLLCFARGGEFEIKPISLNALFEITAELFVRTKKEVLIQKKFQKDLFTVEVDPGQIEQVLLNLFLNACQAMPEGGNLFLETKNVVFDKKNKNSFGLKAGKYVLLTVKDTGCGMDEGVKQRIFEPFFTTKERGIGTGLGLFTAYGIIKNHKGHIRVESTLGKGCTFFIYLPASTKVVLPEENGKGDEIFKGKETILLVDDEDVIFDVGKKVLNALGYNVLIASNGKDAIRIFKENQGKIDLVILDIIMPGMGGGEVFNRLKTIDPGVKVILSSGYDKNGQTKDIVNRGCSGFIQKPFTISKLSKKIREVLDKDAIKNAR